jgi:hypothetical protein
MHSVQSMGRRDACLSTYLPTYNAVSQHALYCSWVTFKPS